MICVLLAAYNGSKYIAQQMSSIVESCSNAGVDYKIIVSDDFSSDDTISIVNSFSSSRIVVLKPEDKGGSALRNFSFLLEQSDSSEYFLFSDHDDVWFEEKVRLSLEKMKEMEKKWGKKTPLLCFTDSKVVDSELNEVASSFWSYEKLNPEICNNFKSLVVQNVAQGCTMVINRSLLQKSRPIPQGAMMHDRWLMLVAAAFGKIDYINEPTLLYRQHGANELGAKGFSLDVVFEKAVHQREALKSSIAATQRQAQAFVDRFGSELDDDLCSFLEKYAHLDECNILARKLFCLQHRLKKTNLLRTLGFYLLV